MSAPGTYDLRHALTGGQCRGTTVCARTTQRFPVWENVQGADCSAVEDIGVSYRPPVPCRHDAAALTAPLVAQRHASATLPCTRADRASARGGLPEGALACSLIRHKPHTHVPAHHRASVRVNHSPDRWHDHSGPVTTHRTHRNRMPSSVVVLGLRCATFLNLGPSLPCPPRGATQPRTTSRLERTPTHTPAIEHVHPTHHTAYVPRPPFPSLSLPSFLPRSLAHAHARTPQSICHGTTCKIGQSSVSCTTLLRFASPRLPSPLPPFFLAFLGYPAIHTKIVGVGSPQQRHGPSPIRLSSQHRSLITHHSSLARPRDTIPSGPTIMSTFQSHSPTGTCPASRICSRSARATARGQKRGERERQEVVTGPSEGEVLL